MEGLGWYHGSLINTREVYMVFNLGGGWKYPIFKNKQLPQNNFSKISFTFSKICYYRVDQATMYNLLYYEMKNLPEQPCTTK